MKGLVWARDTDAGYPRFKTLRRGGGYFSVSERHGGSWIAAEYGPRGELKKAQDFWQPGNKAQRAKDWCQAIAHGKKVSSIGDKET